MLIYYSSTTAVVGSVFFRRIRRVALPGSFAKKIDPDGVTIASHHPSVFFTERRDDSRGSGFWGPNAALFACCCRSLTLDSESIGCLFCRSGFCGMASSKGWFKAAMADRPDGLFAFGTNYHPWRVLTLLNSGFADWHVTVKSQLNLLKVKEDGGSNIF